jgi:hypothetical protein
MKPHKIKNNRYNFDVLIIYYIFRCNVVSLKMAVYRRNTWEGSSYADRYKLYNNVPVFSTTPCRWKIGIGLFSLEGTFRDFLVVGYTSALKILQLHYFNTCTVHLLLFCTRTIIVQLFHKLSPFYMFRHYSVILRQRVTNTLLSHTSITNSCI